MTTVERKRRYGLAEAKNRLSSLTADANRTGRSFVILKNNVPWVEVRPLAMSGDTVSAIHIQPVRHEVDIPDLDALFEGYAGGFVPSEDGFSDPIGAEEM